LSGSEFLPVWEKTLALWQEGRARVFLEDRQAV
jgi:hypothetical protein